MCVCVIKQYNLVPAEAVMACSWEGNPRSGIALAMHQAYNRAMTRLGTSQEVTEPLTLTLLTPTVTQQTMFHLRIS